MITISLCMIVKNEETVLGRCLDTITDLMDEVIIVDTGSTDETKKIAYSYTDKVYDYAWTGDFSAARNYAFSKATCDYIYTADADELLDEENRVKFRLLKQTIDPEIEIVQMYYANQLDMGTVYNFDRELRPKLFKRIRQFTWIEKVHETVRTLPLVFDSDIEIIHKPLENHASRDFSIFEKIISSGEKLSERLTDFYAKELFVSGTESDFGKAENYFTAIADSDETSPDMLKTALCIVAKAAYYRADYLKMYRYAMKDIADNPSSETCFVLGKYYEECHEYEEAAIWYYNAAFECHGILNIKYEKEYPLKGLISVYSSMGLTKKAYEYEELLNQ